MSWFSSLMELGEREERKMEEWRKGVREGSRETGDKL